MSWMQGTRRRRLPLPVAVVAGLVGAALSAIAMPTSAQASPSDPCAAPTNPVVCENSKAGTPESTWDVPTEDSSILGFATDMSVNAGSSVSFKVKTTAAYTITVYRLGYYQGNGARQITTLTPTARTQPACLSDAGTKLLDCGNWLVSATWAVPATAVSGVYVAKLRRNDTGGASLVPFIVRSDASTSDVLFQTSDSTWQAYNYYGNVNFYGGPAYQSNNRAFKLSYNRPFITRGWEGGRDYLFSNEYPMIRFLEANGYDVSYFTNVDADRRGSLIKNHKVFLTAGHDEYWSGAQRANVKAARDAGVNLAFFTGNDNYWKTRWENSVDGTNTSYRTLVTYKETWANDKIDPSAEWTGTWRDPRFTPPSDGGLPENELGGTLFTSNATDLPITVNSEEGKLRIWRNTALANQSAGTSTALAAHTVGYESNEDVDNGFRPAGLIDMSTTTGTVSAQLFDFGTLTGSAVHTHHITLYKAPSGALVFSAGSVQWAWGLDVNHDGNGAAADSRIRQATVNLLADMGAQPLTLQSGLTAATKTTDTTKPVSVITSPVSGTTIANGTKVTATGTATDVGGKVGGVEVSTDGGATWHPATGRGSWSYTFVASGSGSVTIKSRAADDSGNIETPSAGKTVTVNCPCSLFGQATPGTLSENDSSDLELGVKFKPTTSGFITGIRFYKGTGNTGTHTGTLWTAAGASLATGTFTGETATGWQTLTFASPVSVTAGTTYVASYRAPAGHYSDTINYFSYRDWVAGPLTAPRSIGTTVNGVFANGGQFPTESYADTNYYVDVVFSTTNNNPPTVTSTNPASGATSVPTSSKVSATFSMPVQPATITFSVTKAGAAVAGSVAYDSATNTATFTPSAALTESTSYTATVSGAKSVGGVAMSAPTTWSFTTSGANGCPCSLFPSGTTPGTVDGADTAAVTLGVKFTPNTGGQITGVKFYKAAANTGTHTGALWSSSGTQLASGTFTNETASGWQTLTFASPVTVTAGTTYTASYFAPVGHYSINSNYFTSAYTNGPLTAPATTNGVFRYGASTGFPSSSWSSANYWVDVLFTPVADNTPPSVTSTTPASAATGVATGTTVKATFAAPVQPATVSFTLSSSGGSVAGATSYDSGTNTVTFTPSAALAASTTYTATVSGAKSTSGVVMTAPKTWSFTTAAPGACPCSLWNTGTVPGTVDGADAAAVTLGVKFTPNSNGQITGIRFYKAAANTGTHTGALWSSSGTQLASGTFTNETASGWQTLTFASPVAVTAGTTYTASYFAPVGHYSINSNYFTSAFTNGPLTAPATTNGVFRYGTSTGFPSSSWSASNYWVDVIFQ